MKFTDDDTRQELLKRLRRIEGQVRGVQKMIDEDRDCREIIQQLTAIRSAVQQASLQVARSYATHCLTDAQGGAGQDKLVDDLIEVLSKAG